MSEQAQIPIGEYLELHIKFADLVFHKEDGIRESAAKEDGVCLVFRRSTGIGFEQSFSSPFLVEALAKKLR